MKLCSSQVESQNFAHISEPYLLITPIPFFIDKNGAIWMDHLWLLDLVRHLDYLLNLTLVAPKHRLDEDKNNDLVLVDQSDFKNKIRFIPLLPQTSLIKSLLYLPNTISVLFREVKRAKIVHSGIVGWPIPLGWIANPIALLLKRRLVLVVESAPWRLSGNGPFKVRDHVRAAVTEHLGRFFMKRTDLAIVTQPSYLESLRGKGSRGIEFVNPATWIAEDHIVSAVHAKKIWADKRLDLIKSPRFLFAGRLVSHKGVNILLDALVSDKLQDIRAKVDIIGNGPLLERCKQLEGSINHLQIRVLPMVEYGNPFFELLRYYHAVLIPSISDEQPRIIFDAYSQAVPVVASNTDGIRPNVTDGNTGWLVAPGSSMAIAEVILEIAHNPNEVERRGLAALKAAKFNTHREMHRKRSHVLAELI